MRGYFRTVDRLTGKNPVAQAVARAKLAKAIVDQKIAVLMLRPGEACVELLAGLAATMQVVLTASQSEHMDSVDTRVLKGGLNACIQTMQADAYDPMQTVAILQGLDKALLLAAKVKPDSINKAWQETNR